MFPIVVGIELAFFEEPENLAGFHGTNHRPQTDRRRIALRHHHFQAARKNPQHVVFFGSAVQDSKIDLLDDPYSVVWIDDLFTDLIVHRWISPREHFKFKKRCIHKSRYIS